MQKSHWKWWTTEIKLETQKKKKKKKKKNFRDWANIKILVSHDIYTNFFLLSYLNGFQSV